MIKKSKIKIKNVPKFKKKIKKNIKEEKWLSIKSKAFVNSTPAMKRSIDRTTKNVYIKTLTNYRAKDGTAITTAITAEKLIAERLGKSIVQQKLIKEQNNKNFYKILNSNENIKNIKNNNKKNKKNKK